MRLILEGPDNAGKTTLARKLTDELGQAIFYFHPGGKPDSLAAELECMSEQFTMIVQHSNILMDRVTCISQRVYNPDPAQAQLRADALSRLQTMAPVVVYCRPSTDRLLRVQDFKWRPGETDEHKQKIISGQHTFVTRYDELMRGVPHVHYDWEDEVSARHIYQNLVYGFMGRTVSVNTLYHLMNLRGM